MVTQVKRIIGLIYLLGIFASSTCYAQSIQPYIELTIDTPEIYLGDSVIVNIESTGLLDPIDISLLDSAATFDRETVGTRIAVYQGKVVEISLRRMEFTPIITGSQVLGPVTAGDVTSNSVSINVLDAVNSQWSLADDDLSIDISLSTVQPYVHSQVILDIELKHRYPISDESIQLPSLDELSPRPVFEERRTFTNESHDLRRTAWRYLLFPEHSGSVTIGPISWNGMAIKSRPERAVFNRTSDPLTLNINPAIPGVNQWWLPASSLSLEETWSSEVTAVKAGDEVTRTIKIQTTGIQARQIPVPVILESRALSQTLVTSSRSDDIIDDQIVAHAEFVYRVKFKSPIPVFLDTVRIPWWNTETNAITEAIIPARRINVGLPERGDLLKAIALTETGTTRLAHWIKSAAVSSTIIYALAVVSVSGILVLVLRKMVNGLTSWSRRRQIKRELKQLATTQNWEVIYTRLMELDAEHWLIDKTDPFFIGLQEKLFSDTTVVITRKAVNRFIRQLKLQKIQSTDLSSKTYFSTLTEL